MAFDNLLRKRKNASDEHLDPFPQNVFYLFEDYISDHWSIFDFLSSNTYNIDSSKILLLGEECTTNLY